MDSLSDITLENLDPETMAAPDERIASVADARRIYTTMVDADRGSALQRTRHQKMWDGEPPYSQQALIASGQGSITNLNWGDASFIMDQAKSGMIDLISSVERLVKIPLKRQFFTDHAQRKKFEEIIADEVTRTLRQWDGFDPEYQNLINHWLGHGVGVAYWDDAINWQWSTTGLGDFHIPRKTKAGEKYIETCTFRREYEIHELYGKIKNEEAASKIGWDVPCVKRAILKADSKSIGGEWSQNSWEQIQTELKNNDLGYSSAKTATIKVVHMLVQEFDQTVSLYLFTEDAIGDNGSPEKFLYKKRGAYSEMRKAVTFFTYGVGTNCTYHSISGMLRLIYPQVQVSNRLRSRMVDAAAVASGISIQPLDELSYDKMQYVPMGPYTILPPESAAKVVERASPNLSQNVTPVLLDMQNTIAQRAGQFQGSSPLGGGVEKTRFQVQAEIETLSRVGMTQLALFYPAWGRLLNNAVRRLCNKNYSANSPGGKEAVELRKRLRLRGIDDAMLEIIDFDAVTCEKAVGAGSAAARTAMLTEIGQVAGGFDAVGYHNYKRDIVAAAARSYEFADRYITEMPGDSRPPMDAQIAEMENSLMALGQPVIVEVNQDHVTHIERHLPKIEEIMSAVEQGQMTLEEATPKTILIHQNCVEHLQNLERDHLIQDRVAGYREVLQQAGEIIWNGQKKIQAAQLKQQQGQPGEQDAQTEDNAAINRKIIEFQVKLDQIREASAVKQQIKAQEAAQKMRLREAEFQQKAMFNDANNAARLLSTSQQ